MNNWFINGRRRTLKNILAKEGKDFRNYRNQRGSRKKLGGYNSENRTTNTEQRPLNANPSSKYFSSSEMSTSFQLPTQWHPNPPKFEDNTNLHLLADVALQCNWFQATGIEKLLLAAEVLN